MREKRLKEDKKKERKDRQRSEREGVGGEKKESVQREKFTTHRHTREREYEVNRQQKEGVWIHLMFGVKTFRSATPSLFPPFPTSITYVLPSVYYIRPARGLGGSFFPLSHLAAKITKHVKVNKHGRCSKEARKAEFILYPGWVLVNMSPNARFMN